MRAQSGATASSMVSMALILAVGACCNSQALDSPPEREQGFSRPAAVAGAFYPADSTELAEMVDGMMARAAISPDDFSGTLICAVVPHAGYVYSGSTAAHVYQLLSETEESPDVVVLVSSAHSVPFRGISVFDGVSYLTPLGPVPIARDVAERLRQAHPSAGFAAEVHVNEHTIEVQLPFLQRCLQPGFSVVPVLLGQTGEDDLLFLAELLAAEAAANPRMLLLASSDLSHYPSRSTAAFLDSCTTALFAEESPEGFLDGVARLEARGEDGVVTCACGQTAMFVALAYSDLRGHASRCILDMSTSADAGADPSSVVGYAAIGVFLEGDSASGMGLTALEKAWLCDLVRAELDAAVIGTADQVGDPPPGSLDLPAGVFVTYSKNGSLRGCIGTLRPVMPLREAVARMARSAALEDPRFPPISAEELPDIEFEISVLTPMQLVADPAGVRVGTDGLYIVSGQHSGVLLPQVPVEQAWSREEFLRAVCRKAGLPEDAYLYDHSLLYRFQAEVFGPSEHVD